MANTIITPTIIAREALFHLENNLVMAHCVHRDYQHEFVKVGSTVNIRKPVQFTVTDGATRTNQDVFESNTSIVVDKRKHVSWSFVTQDLTLTIEEYAKRYIEPAAIVLANKIDEDLTALYQDLWLSKGTPGTTPNAFSQLGDLAAGLDDMPVPDDGNRKLVLNPAARWSMADALKGIYDNSMPRDYVRKGLLGQLANFMIFGDQNVARHTTGGFSGTVLVDDAAIAEGDTTIGMDAFTDAAPTVKKGDIFTMAGVNSVNRVSKSDTGNLQQFVVTADATGASNEITSVAFQPELRTTGARQTVTALPADDAAVTFLGTASTAYAQNLGFHRNALALVMVPLELPDGASWKARVQHDGLSIRIVKDYDIDNDEEVVRMDVLYGVKTIYPELGGRLWGA